MDEDPRHTALSFLKRNKVGVLATVSPEGDAHSSTVYYSADDDFNVYFLTPINTRKFKALQSHPQVAFTISTSDIPQTLQIEGVAIDITLDEEAAAKKDELFKVLNSNAWFYGPITKLDPAETAVVWLKPSWVRWADYAFAEHGSGHVFTEIAVQK